MARARPVQAVLNAQQEQRIEAVAVNGASLEAAKAL